MLHVLFWLAIFVPITPGQRLQFSVPSIGISEVAGKPGLKIFATDTACQQGAERNDGIRDPHPSHFFFLRPGRQDYEPG
jgi:hypothetical protein